MNVKQFKLSILQTADVYNLILVKAAVNSSLQSIFINKTGEFKKEKVFCNLVLPRTAKVFIFAYKYFR